MKTCVHKFSFLTRLSNYPDCVHLSPNLHTDCVHLIIFSFWGRSSQLLFKPAGECWKKKSNTSRGGFGCKRREGFSDVSLSNYAFLKILSLVRWYIAICYIGFLSSHWQSVRRFLCLCQPGPRGGEGWQFPVDNGPGRGAVTLANHWDTSDRWHLYGKVGLEIPKNI